jgi:hypothetical protein
MAAREEDKAMAGLLRRSLAQDAGAGAGAGSGENCPEPELLAAYFDHALDAEETARYDLHFSRCPVCREQLAAIARAGGVGEPDAAEKKSASAWAWLTGPRWLMPAAAMIVALLAITGIASRMRKPAVPATEIALVRPDAALPANPASAASSAASPEGAPSSGAESPPPSAATNALVVPPSAPRESGSTRELGARPQSRVAEGAHATTRRGELSRVGVAGDSAGKSAAAPVRQPMAQKPAPQASPGIVRGAMRAGNASDASCAVGGAAASGSGGGVAGGIGNSADETAAVTEAAPPLDTAQSAKLLPKKKVETDSAKGDSAVSVEAAPQPNARKATSSATKSATGAAAPTQSAKAMNLAASKATEAAELAKMQQAQISSNLMNLQIQTPDPKILWMVAGPDAIEKSEDGGGTWKLEYLETRARVIAGSAPSVKICWLVGENGTIQRTTNGAHWKTIKPPEQTDFVHVEATDASIATVTTLDGRKFSTSDGGKSWNNVE